MLTCLVSVLFTFYIQDVLKLKKNNNNAGAKGLIVVHTPTNAPFIKLGKVLRFALKYTVISLLHVSVYDHYQGTCTAPG